MYQVPNFSGPYSDMRRAGGDMSGFGGGTNQWMDFPSMSSPGFPQLPGMTNPSSMTTPPGVVPQDPHQGTQYPVSSGPFPDYGTGGNTGLRGVGSTDKLPGNQQTVPTVDPMFTKAFDSWLRTQIGKGATPFNLSAVMPSTGKATDPGTLTAPLNPVLQSLEEFFTKGTGGPLSEVLPMWQAEMKAMDIPIQKELANIKEQFGARGALGSSEMASAMGDFGAQTARDQEALLGQLTLQALPGMEQFGSNLQQLDQGSIDRLVQEFMRTRPEYSPLLQEESAFATTYPPSYGKKGFTQAFGQSFGSGLGSGLATLITGH